MKIAVIFVVLNGGILLGYVARQCYWRCRRDRQIADLLERVELDPPRRGGGSAKPKGESKR